MVQEATLSVGFPGLIRPVDAYRDIVGYCNSSKLFFFWTITGLNLISVDNLHAKAKIG